jgi:hypothetical protein
MAAVIESIFVIGDSQSLERRRIKEARPPKRHVEIGELKRKRSSPKENVTLPCLVYTNKLSLV